MTAAIRLVILSAALGDRSPGMRVRMAGVAMSLMLPIGRLGRWLLPGSPARRDGSPPQGRSPARARPGAAERSGAALIRRHKDYSAENGLRIEGPTRISPARAAPDSSTD